MLKILETPSEGNLVPALDELIREGARRLLMVALENEVAEYIEAHVGERGEDGRALVVRNGRARPRQVTTGAGTMEIAAPRVNDRRSGQRFSSRILPPYMRRSPKVAEVLPLLYLRGLSTGDFREALTELLGEKGVRPVGVEHRSDDRCLGGGAPVFPAARRALFNTTSNRTPLTRNRMSAAHTI